MAAICYALKNPCPMMTPTTEAMENVSAVGATRSITEVERSAVGGLASYATTQSFQMAGMHIQDAITSGADCTPCPLCHLNLDSRQPEVERSSVAGSTSAAFAVDCSGTGH